MIEQRIDRGTLDFKMALRSARSGIAGRVNPSTSIIDDFRRKNPTIIDRFLRGEWADKYFTTEFMSADDGNVNRSFTRAQFVDQRVRPLEAYYGMSTDELIKKVKSGLISIYDNQNYHMWGIYAEMVSMDLKIRSQILKT